ncbi:MAG: HAD-IIB family hydrolase [Planctomycetota bacterium]
MQTSPGVSRRRYDLIAIDLDGTLLAPGGRVPDANIRAVRRAIDAGYAVSVCTGRSWAESRFALEAIGVDAPMVSAGGSMIVDPHSGETLHRYAMPDSVVRGVVERFTARGLASLVLKDPGVSPHDYLVVLGDGATLDPVSEWWFEALGVTYRMVESLDEDEHPEWSVRVGACAPSDSTLPIRDELMRAYERSLLFHSFPAVAAPELVKDAGPRGEYHVVEAFDVDAHKWSGVAWVCDRLGLDPARTVAIGDEINDVTMIQGAGLGIAMGNAVDEVARVADRRTARNDEAGLAQAIDRVLAGVW